MGCHRVPTRATFSAIALLLAVMAASLGGCASYVVPGGPADFRALGITASEQEARTDAVIAVAMSREPAASFPARIAVARLQDAGYRNYSGYGYGSGRVTVQTVRDVESDEDFQRLADLPQVAGIAQLNRLVLPNTINDAEDLRVAAAQVKADMLLVYTFDTKFGVETIVPVLGTITLGLFPSEESRVNTTCSLALIDVRTGYIYGLGESSAKAEQLASGWTSSTAIDQSRRRAEAEAFTGAVDEFVSLWQGIAAEYSRPASPIGVRYETPG
jgi:hypothetical protein